MGDGTFSAGTTIATPSQGVGSLVSGDFDGDRVTDLIYQRTTGFAANSAYFAKGAGDGTFAASTVVAGVTLATYATAVDWNRDGVLDLVSLGHWPRRGAFGAIDAPLREKAREALASVGLSGFEQRRIGELSVGQFQRVLFARVLLQDAQLILLDEPFNAIDARTSADLLAVVRRWHGEARTVVAVLHDMELVRENFPQTLLLAREAVAWGPTAQVLHAENLFRARQMSERWDESAPVCERA